MQNRRSSGGDQGAQGSAATKLHLGEGICTRGLPTSRAKGFLQEERRHLSPRPSGGHHHKNMNDLKHVWITLLYYSTEFNLYTNPYGCNSQKF